MKWTKFKEPAQFMYIPNGFLRNILGHSKIIKSKKVSTMFVLNFTEYSAIYLLKASGRNWAQIISCHNVVMITSFYWILK